ncbi:MAG: integrase family protein [Coxiellaceae bacterium]|nr:integrase family protein [Coxiellaceae bacterium]
MNRDNHFNFTKKSLLYKMSLLKSAKWTYYYDTKLPGLVFGITPAGSKSFLIYKKIKGRPVRYTLGRFPAMTVEQARRAGQKILGQIASGANPNQQKKANRFKVVTLGEVFTDFLIARKSLKALTILDYKRSMHEAFSDWQKKPILNISRDMVARRHRKIGERSHARANLAMRVLRALFNFAAGEYEDENGKAYILENPVSRISHTRAWYRVERRKTVIKAHELPSWHQAIESIKEEYVGYQCNAICDCLLLIVFTGLRRSEAMSLRWDSVDFNSGSITIADTKNSEQHVLPLSSYLSDLLLKRRIDAYSNFVFPGDGKLGYIVEPRKTMVKITERSGIKFTLHDLRRTFITVAESLDIPAYSLKRLLNHKMNQDVTAGYIITDVERLRGPMQQITDYLLQCMKTAQCESVLVAKLPD